MSMSIVFQVVPSSPSMQRTPRGQGKAGILLLTKLKGQKDYLSCVVLCIRIRRLDVILLFRIVLRQWRKSTVSQHHPCGPVNEPLPHQSQRNKLSARTDSLFLLPGMRLLRRTCPVLPSCIGNRRVDSDTGTYSTLFLPPTKVFHCRYLAAYSPQICD